MRVRDHSHSHSHSFSLYHQCTKSAAWTAGSFITKKVSHQSLIVTTRRSWNSRIFSENSNIPMRKDEWKRFLTWSFRIESHIHDNQNPSIWTILQQSPLKRIQSEQFATHAYTMKVKAPCTTGHFKRSKFQTRRRWSWSLRFEKGRSTFLTRPEANPSPNGGAKRPQ